MRVLVVGSGGREHALAWRLSQSPLVERLLAAPGNAGIGDLADRFPLAADDVAGIVELVEREDVDLTIVGPEGPLVAGLGNELRGRSRRVFGPSRQAAALEGSKAFAKSVMQAAGVPTAEGEVFREVGEAVRFVDLLGGHAVVKADGLAAGKGVTVTRDRATAVAALEDCLVRAAFGTAGATVLVEEVLEGSEVSAFALCDGETVMPLALSQDFKRIGEGDTGPNTGGMGAYSPLRWVDPAVEELIWSIARRTVDGLRSLGIAYHGLLYVGLMLTADGPKVLEFNCRFGDPETVAVLPRLRGDLAELLLACAEGRLAEAKVDWTDEVGVTVVIASGGYPGACETGHEIRGLDDAADVDGAIVFHAGTEGRAGRVVTTGGRVVAVSAVGDGFAQARARAYEACSQISFEGMRYRSDIAARAAEEERA